jgi:hypothetical protein
MYVWSVEDAFSIYHLMSFSDNPSADTLNSLQCPEIRFTMGKNVYQEVILAVCFSEKK